jgi:hypothetical protein
MRKFEETIVSVKKKYCYIFVLLICGYFFKKKIHMCLFHFMRLLFKNMHCYICLDILDFFGKFCSIL